jgi:hypothetical protein
VRVWIEMVQDRVQWRIFVKTVKNLLDPKKGRGQFGEYYVLKKVCYHELT